MSDAAPPKALAWARPWAITKPFARPSTRAGAWYPVVGRTADSRIVLEIRGRKVAVERRLVEVRPKRPDRFTVVTRPKGEAHPGLGTDADLGSRYGVCPSCGARVPLFGDPVTLTCGTCQHSGEVAYWETG